MPLDPDDVTRVGAADLAGPDAVPGRESLVGKILDGRFTVLSRIGEGGMGVVYRAHQNSMRRDVALKVIRRELADREGVVKRFLREARAVSRLTNPHTITVYDSGCAPDGTIYIAMELLKGRTLANVLDEHPGVPMDPDRAVRIVLQVLDSLGEAHRRNVLHRDLKPDNVFILETTNARDFVKLLDFGVAKLLDPGATVLTANGQACGTPAYMSPEQAQGLSLDARSDLYSVGTLLFEMLAGRLPFVADTAVSLATQKVRQAAPAIRDVRPDAKVPPALETAVARMLEAEPSRRPKSAAEAASLLSIAVGRKDLSVLPLPITVSGRAVQTPVRLDPAPGRLVWIGAVILGVLLGAALSYLVLVPDSGPAAMEVSDYKGMN